MTVECIRFSHQSLFEHIDTFATLLCDGVNGGAAMSFVAPLSIDDARTYWQKVVDAIEQEEMILLAAVKETKIVGSVQLSMPWQPNAPHRA